MVRAGERMHLEDWRRKGRSFEYGGHRLFFRDEGQGDALLCIHGFPTASWDWHRIWPALTGRFRTVAPDLLGFGFSDKPPRYPYSLVNQATLLEQLIAHLGIVRTHVLAHDYGDSVAQELLARHEARARSGRPGLQLLSVCFLNGGLFPESHRPLPVQKLLAGPLGPLLARLMTEARFRKNFGVIFGPDTQPSEAELADFWHLFSINGGVRLAPRLLGYMEERRRNRERWVNAMRETRVPLRVIDGAVDPISGAHMVERYRELVPHPDTVLLEGVGHYPQVEAAEQVSAAFLEFAGRA